MVETNGILSTDNGHAVSNGTVSNGAVSNGAVSNGAEKRDVVDNVVIDTDCGVDDMFCIANFLSLHKKNKCKLLGITTVCGNIPTESAFQNTCKMVKDVFGVADVPVFKSSSSGFNDPHCSLFYGEDGHCGVLKSLSDTVHKQPAASAEQFLVETLKTKADVTIIAIGPLTNLHAVEKMSPGILGRAKSIIIMGGNIEEEGNCPKTNFTSEYNFGMDGEAAACVLRSSPNVCLVPLDVTSNVRFDMENILGKTKTAKQKEFFSKVMAGMLAAMVQEGECGPDERHLNIHDLHCFTYYLHPELYLVEQEILSVDQNGVITRNAPVSSGNSVKVVWSGRDSNRIETLVTLMFDNLL